jgi:tetratricopeptide (TPR) repeat protein
MKFIIFISFIALFINCVHKTPSFYSLPEGVQAVSLLGDTLKTPNLNFLSQLSQRLDSLISKERSSDAETEAVIWEARRLSYQGEYRSAVTLLTNQISVDGKNPALYRHRGHRYITLRAFDLAIDDLEKAAELIRGKNDIVEQDGLPNALNRPTSTLHTNIWYHLGLAYYITGDFDKAQQAYVECINASTNDDMLVASVYWYYMTLKRDGQDEFAGTIIEPIETEMDIIENDSYHKLLLVFKGEFNPELILDAETDPLNNATLGYGIGNWHFINGRVERANEIWTSVYEAGNWASFGYIASEAELAAKKR